MNKFKEQAMKIVFMVAACASVLAVFLICLFLFANGLPAIAKIGPVKFLLGTTWKPSNDKFGIFPMIIASIYVTGGAILIGVPIALFTSVFMARYCPQKIYRPLKSGIELMAGVPSIVYGFFGLVLMVPLIRNTFGGTGTSWRSRNSRRRRYRLRRWHGRAFRRNGRWRKRRRSTLRRVGCSRSRFRAGSAGCRR